MEVFSNSAVAEKFSQYPTGVKPKMDHLRELILAAAREQGIPQVEETLKWGEPSYLTKKGSTVRIDWKKAKPGQYAIYFKCTSKLVDTFKAVYGDLFTYEKSRAIVFKLDEPLPETALKHCISMALNYHEVKHLPLLGAEV